jgi:uncharacterized lipoprotein
MRIAVILLVTVLSAAMFSGCKSGIQSCHQSDKDYAGAAEIPPLQAPPGLAAPDTRNALKVPPLNTPERVRGKGEPCLDAPPPFASSATASPKPAEPQNPK